MKMKFIILIALFTLGFQAAKAQKNLVTNSGFEEELDAWVDYTAKTTPYIYKSGSFAAALFSSDAGKWTGMHQVVAIPKKSQYILLSAWLKADEVAAGKESWSGGMFLFEWLNSGGEKVGEGSTITAVTGSKDWQLYQKAFFVPAGVAKVKLMFALGYATGTLFIDEVSMKVLSLEEFEKYQ